MQPNTFTHGSGFAATLGFGTEPLRGSDRGYEIWIFTLRMPLRSTRL
jgi:hypothetical protein